MLNNTVANNVMENKVTPKIKIRRTGEELEPFELLIDGKHIGYYDTRQEAKDHAAYLLARQPA